MQNSVAAEKRAYMQAETATPREHGWRWLSILCRLVVVGLGALHAWAAATSHSMNTDGISYLDIGDAYMRGDWQAAINPIWSPMYSWLLGPILYVLNPSMRWEFPVVHLVNFAIYLGALFCFEYLWRQLWRYKETLLATQAEARLIALPDWIWWPLGYALFTYTSLNLIAMWAVTPDMLMSCFVYLAGGLLVRLRMKDGNRRIAIAFGAILGLGYLAKAIMFPVSFMFLAASVFAPRDWRWAIPRTLLALLVFLIVSLPFITLISNMTGKWTFSEAGTLTYARYMNDIPYPHWRGETPTHGVPLHPSRKILDTPPVYEFGTPIAGTYPIAHNPAYWYAGMELHPNIPRQIDYLLFSTLFYLDLFFQQLVVLLIGVLLLYRFGQWSALRPRDILAQWGLLIPALAAFGAYALVNVLGRYVGVFVVLLAADLLANIRLADSRNGRKLASTLAVLMLLSILVNIGTFNLRGFRDLTGLGNPHQLSVAQTPAPSWPGHVAEELHALGVEAGDSVGVIGYAFESFWARLAHVQIVAELLSHQAAPFWQGTPAQHSIVLDAFARAGAKAVVAEYVPAYTVLHGWHQVGNTNFYIYLLDE